LSEQFLDRARKNCYTKTRKITLPDSPPPNNITVKLLIKAPGVYLNTDLKTPAFIRDPAFNRSFAVVKIPDFRDFISLDRMNSVFSFNKHKKNIIPFFAAG